MYKSAIKLFKFSEVNGINIGVSESEHGAGFGENYLFSIINSLHFHSSSRIQYFSVVSRTTSLKPTAL